MKYLTLTEMKAGQTGKVAGISGGRGMNSRLEAMGFKVGKKLTKTSSMLLRGPVTVKIGTTQVALGYGIANKVLVEVI